MKIPAFVFRFRYAIHVVIFALGFFTPWNRIIPIDPSGPNAHVWGLLSANISETGVCGIMTAFNLLLGIGIACALAGAALRTWGSAYIGASIVSDSTMHTAADSDGILKDGPFGHMRNPLYVGTFLHTLALALLMPRSGAIFTIACIALLQIALILSEEHFLTQKLGTPYTAYCALVPRLFPALRRKVSPSGLTPRWGQAFLGEPYFWCVALFFTFAGWRYNAVLLIQCVVVSAGVSLVLRALLPRNT